MHKNYKVDEQVIILIINRHIKPTGPQNQINLIMYYTKFQTSNIIVKNNINSTKTLRTQTNVVNIFTCPF